MRGLLRDPPGPGRGVVASDLMALGAMPVLLRAVGTCPGTSVVGFDDSSAAPACTPR